MITAIRTLTNAYTGVVPRVSMILIGSVIVVAWAIMSTRSRWLIRKRAGGTARRTWGFENVTCAITC